MNITLYGIRNCDTVKRARAWLERAGVMVEFHDFKTQGLPDTTVNNWVRAHGALKLINRQGRTWRQLEPAAQQAALVDTSSAIALMKAQPSVIKRPVVQWADGSVTVGFDEGEFAAHIHKEST